MNKFVKDQLKKAGHKTYEVDVHLAVAGYLKSQYPKIIFRTDFGAGVKLPIKLAVLQKKLQWGRAWLDLQIVAQMHGHIGMFLELKRDDERIFKKDGVRYVSDHIREQAEMMDGLRKMNYYCCFAIGFDQAKGLIDWYLGEKINPFGMGKLK